MAKPKKSRAVSVSLIVILGIILFVVVLLVVVRATQTGYSHKISSLTFSTYTGPVSPEFQQRQTLSLTPGSCQYTVEKFAPASTTSTACTMSAANFQKIAASFNTYNMAEKIQAQGSKTDQNLIGGKQQMISAQLNDGTTLTAQVNKAFLDSVGPFIDDAELYAPQMNALQF